MSSPESSGSPGPRPFRAFLISLALSALVLSVALVSDSRVLELKRARADVVALDRQIDELTRQNAELERKLEETRTTSFPAERVAREELNLVKPGDVVLMLEPPAAATPAPAPKPPVPRP
jgi:cell division protein FtsB